VALLAAVALVCGVGPAAGAVAVRATLDTRRIGVGETATLELVVTGGGLLGSVGEPELNAPPGLEVVGSGRAQNYSWVNGQAANETVFRYEVGAGAVGRYVIGPIRVRAGNDVAVAPAVVLEVAAARPQGGGSPAVASGTPAVLMADVMPRNPWVGQPMVLRVRLVLRAPLAEDPAYTPPTTPGFWAEAPGRPETYYANLDGQRVLVTEQRSRIYPLAPGRAVIGEGSANLVLSGSDNPLLWSMGRVPRREVTVRSTPVVVNVRTLPPGAPAGFDGAVGNLTVSWSADRSRTPQDVPFAVRLDVRGIGNVPLIHTPAIDSSGAEVFAGTLDDSLGPPGSTGAVRRRFQWNVLAHQPGRLRLDAPALSWFDPAATAYRRADPPPVVIDVGPPAGTAGAGPESFPAPFGADDGHPGARGPAPWAWALAGGLLGGAVALWRSKPPAPDPALDRFAAWRAALTTPGVERAEFWRAAEEAARWLAGDDPATRSLVDGIAAARYGGGGGDPVHVKRELVRQLDRRLGARGGARVPRRPVAVAVTVAAVALAAWFGPRLGNPRAAAEVHAADATARGGDVDQAAARWEALWAGGIHSPALAARLAWAELRGGSLAGAAIWVLRGEGGEPRDPALQWVADRVRESGGLTGDRTPGVPLRSIEWALVALAAAVAAGWLWPRPLPVLVAALVALAAAASQPVTRRLAARSDHGVIAASTPLAGAGVTLEPGEVVRVLDRAGGRVRVSAGRGVEGWVSAPLVILVRPLP
jgi:oxygen tolerance protein BatD